MNRIEKQHIDNKNNKKENWIVPCNPKHLDIKTHLQKTDEIVFKRVRPINTGDIVYIYVSGKNGQIKYKGIVINNNCDKEIMNVHDYAASIESYGQGPFIYMLVRIGYEYPDNTIVLKDLKDHGFGQVQVQARTSRVLQEFLNSKDCVPLSI